MSSLDEAEQVTFRVRVRVSKSETWAVWLCCCGPVLSHAHLFLSLSLIIFVFYFYVVLQESLCQSIKAISSALPGAAAPWTSWMTSATCSMTWPISWMPCWSSDPLVSHLKSLFSRKRGRDTTTPRWGRHLLYFEMHLPGQSMQGGVSIDSSTEALGFRTAGSVQLLSPLKGIRVFFVVMLSVCYHVLPVPYRSLRRCIVDCHWVYLPYVICW